VVAATFRGIGVDDLARTYLTALRDQLPQRTEGLRTDAFNVETGPVAIGFGIVPGSDEHDALLGQLVRGGYLENHPQTIMRSQGVYRITRKGIAEVDDGR
jgi:hypothetical protein